MTLKQILPLAAALALLGTPAMAQNAELQTACANDVKTLCPNIQPGAGRIAKCITEQIDKVSAQCKTAMAAAKPAGTAAPKN